MTRQRSEPSAEQKAGRPKGVAIAGEAVRLRREALYLTQGELATRAATTAKTVQRAERGGPVSLAAARALGRVLSLPLVALLSPEDGLPEVANEARRLTPEPAPSPLWPGRAALVAGVMAALTDPAVAGPRRCALHGAVGVGKSVVARAVAERAAEAFPGGVVWVDARDLASLASLRAAQHAVARSLGLAPTAVTEAAFDRAFRYQLHELRPLVVLDGAAPGARLAGFIGDEPGSACLVTTAYRHVAEGLGGARFEVSPCEPEGAAHRIGRAARALLSDGAAALLEAMSAEGAVSLDFGAVAALARVEEAEARRLLGELIDLHLARAVAAPPGEPERRVALEPFAIGPERRG